VRSATTAFSRELRCLWSLLFLVVSTCPQPTVCRRPLLYALAAPKGSTSRPQHHCTTASADAGLPANGKKQQQQQKEKEDNRDDKEEVEEEAEDSVRRR
jgi:hypothetical protein